MSIEAADEAQAMLQPGVRVETGRISNGVVDRVQIADVPEEFFQTVQNAVSEQLIMARNVALRDYPNLAATSVVERLVLDGVVDRKDATRACDLVELEVRRGIERFYSNAHDRFAARLPITLRSLVSLIVRRSGTQ